MKEIFFVTNNNDKFKEWQKLSKELIPKIKLKQLIPNFQEIQTDNDEKLVRDKCIKAFRQIGREVVVEHTCLQLPYIGNFPGGLTALFWEKLGSKKISELFGSDKTKSRVTAVTMIGYCNGKTIRIFQGSLNGQIPPKPRGTTTFQWDDIFVPNGYNKTFAEMGTKAKNKISMRRKALKRFAGIIKKAK